MNIDELPNSKQLLIFMLKNESSTTRGQFSIAANGQQVIDAGIAKNKRSLSSTLQYLANNGMIETDGYCNWYLTADGSKMAHDCISKCSSPIASRPGKLVDSLAVSKAIEDVAVNLAVCKVALDKCVSKYGKASIAVQMAIIAAQLAVKLVNDEPRTML